MRQVTSTELRDCVTRGKAFHYDPYLGNELPSNKDRGDDTTQNQQCIDFAPAASTHPFLAAELGLEPFRFCPLCGRRMVTQVMPHGWTACCSRHGELPSTLFEH